MNVAIRLTVHGLPAPQGSKTRMPNGAMVDGSSKTGRANLAAWRDAVRAECRRWLDQHPAPPIAEPVKLALWFRFPATKSDPYRCWHVTTPDLDKCIRAVCDALKQGGVLRDDAFVCAIESTKSYATPAEAIGCTIELESLAEDEAAQRESAKAWAKSLRKAVAS